MEARNLLLESADEIQGSVTDSFESASDIFDSIKVRKYIDYLYKSRRMRCAGHAARMGEKRNA
jgi:hypothetical protein